MFSFLLNNLSTDFQGSSPRPQDESQAETNRGHGRKTDGRTQAKVKEQFENDRKRKVEEIYKRSERKYQLTKHHQNRTILLKSIEMVEIMIYCNDMIKHLKAMNY